MIIILYCPTKIISFNETLTGIKFHCQYPPQAERGWGEADISAVFIELVGQ